MTTSQDSYAAVRVRRRFDVRGSLLFRVSKSGPGAFGLFVVAMLLACAAFAPLIAPYDPSSIDIPSRLESPSWSHPFGTDELGRDVLSRLIYGVRVELAVALPATIGALLVGLCIGLPAGYFGGRIDNALIVVMDTVQAFPALILALVILALLGPSQRNVTIVLVIALAPSYARVARALVLSLKQNQYVEAERALGASTGRIVVTHILPNTLPPLLTLVAMSIPAVIAFEAGLSFLGLGVSPPTPSWGVMLASGFDFVRTDPWPIIFTGLALVVATLGFTFLAEALRDELDPQVAGALR